MRHPRPHAPLCRCRLGPGQPADARPLPPAASATTTPDRRPRRQPIGGSDGSVDRAPHGARQRRRGPVCRPRPGRPHCRRSAALHRTADRRGPPQRPGLSAGAGRSAGDHTVRRPSAPGGQCSAAGSDGGMSLAGETSLQSPAGSSRYSPDQEMPLRHSL